MDRRTLEILRGPARVLPPLHRPTTTNLWDLHQPEECEGDEDKEDAADPVTPTSDLLPSHVLVSGGICVLKGRSLGIPKVPAAAKGRQRQFPWEAEDGEAPITGALPLALSPTIRRAPRTSRFPHLTSFDPAPLLSPRILTKNRIVPVPFDPSV
jgi:hypothetical protein